MLGFGRGRPGTNGRECGVDMELSQVHGCLRSEAGSHALPILM